MVASTTLAVAFTLIRSAVATGDQVCHPSGCLKGSFSSPLVALDNQTHTGLLPGTYSEWYTPETWPQFGQNTSYGTGTTTLSSPAVQIVFSTINYDGSGSESLEVQPNGTVTNWQSVYLPDGWYALATPGNALWTSVPDRSQLDGSSVVALGPFGYGSCNAQCSHGKCSATGQCVCDAGWTGTSCDECKAGHYGNRCTACPANCTSSCDDGLAGSGLCKPHNTTSLEKCNCLHGTCNSKGGCTCSAGFTSSKTNGQLCDTCIEGFYMVGTGRCAACPYTCATCTANTDGSVKCLSCAKGTVKVSEQVDTGAQCQAPTAKCFKGAYLNSNTGECQLCANGCRECVGPLASDCTQCSTTQAMLAGTCVDLDNSGVCETTTGVTYVASPLNHNNCDSCPSGCSSCYIKDFLNMRLLVSDPVPTCTACSEGHYLTSNGTCAVGACAPNQYMMLNGTCAACSSRCATCSGAAEYCTSCTAGMAYNGTCASSCPLASVQVSNTTCTPCHPDCATCSTPGATHCTTCPPSRPVLLDGRCVAYCYRGTFFDKTSNKCAPCSSGCDTCIEGGTCTSCRSSDNGIHVLVAGQCVAATCVGPFIANLGICLSQLITTRPATKNLAPLAALLVVPFLIAVAIWYIRRERAKTRANTKKFGDQMDTADVHKRAAKMDDDVRDMGMTVPRAESEIDIEAEIDGYNTFDKIPMKRFPPTPSKSQRPLSPGSGASEEQPEPPSAKYPYFTPPGTCDSIDLLPSPNFRHHSGYGESILNGYTQPEGLRASSKGAAMYSTTLYPPRPQAPAQVTSPAVPYSHAHLFQTVQAQHTGLSSPSVYSPFPTEGAAFRVPGRPETFGLSPIHSSRDLPVPLAPDHTNTLLHSQGLR